jgi:transcriptional regulator with XRE-family HTH domain
MNDMMLLMKTDETSFFENLGRRIAELRKQQGYTQAQLADMIDVKQYVVASYETGRRRPSAALIPELARILGVTVEELIGIDQDRRKPGPTPKLQQQIEQLQRLPKSKQKFVSEFLETVLQQAHA